MTMGGMGALAALAIGAGPAQAAGTSNSAAAKPSAGQARQHHGGDRTVGYYRSGRACELAGRIGERFGRWDDHDCDFVRFGFHRGQWELQVSRDRRGHGFPGFPGHHRPGNDGPGGFHNRPGHDGPGGFHHRPGR
jgi:hypothetical protein